MALKVNGMRLHTHVNRVFGGNGVAGIYGLGVNAMRGALLPGTGALNNSRAGEHATAGVNALSAVPNGHLAPSAWLLPKTAGGMSTYTRIGGGSAVVNANLAGGLNAEAAIGGVGQVDYAELVPIIQAVAALAGVGTLAGDITGKLEAVAALAGFGEVSYAELNSLLNAAATLAGSSLLTASIAGNLEAAAELAGLGEVSYAEANMVVLAAAALAGAGSVAAAITGAWFMEASLDGDSTLVAGISAPAHLDSVLVGSGGLTATPYASGSMSATITVSAETGELTAEAVAAAVWAYAVRTLTGAGTLTPEQETQLFELWQMSGLDPAKPVSATPSRRFVGDSNAPDIDQTITGNGRTASTITRT